jgi:hypothetical protein
VPTALPVNPLLKGGHWGEARSYQLIQHRPDLAQI